MSMRKDWQTAKEQAEILFKKKHPVGKDPHMTPPTAFPLKFNKDLGPTLDKVEKSGQSLDSLEKAEKKARDVVAAYRNEINQHKATLGNEAAGVLLNALNKIYEKVK